MDKKAVTIDYEFDWGGRIKSAYAIDKMTSQVLESFDKNSTKGTFFISTETIDKTKNNILKIANNGHEIASHGHNHNVQYDKLTKNELNFEIKHSKELLENLTGEKILGFRTPQFRKNRFTEELLINNGYKYDSSSVNTNFLNRYKKNQFHNTDIKNFSVSSILGKLPAGVKWINLFGNFTNKKDDVTIIYLHLFDLLTMKEILDLYDKKIVSKTVLSFYLARVNSVISTVNKVTKESHPLKDFLF